jgi:hypothetical protein
VRFCARNSTQLYFLYSVKSKTIWHESAPICTNLHQLAPICTNWHELGRFGTQRHILGRSRPHRARFRLFEETDRR